MFSSWQEAWERLAGVLAAAVTLAGLVAWRAGAPPWALEGIGIVGAVLWWASGE